MRYSYDKAAVNAEMESMDTGGYTGEWGSEGRLATLHEKEIVLNKTDTANILKAVDIVRSLETSLLQRLGSLTFGHGSIGYDGSKEHTTVDQNVHITAEFPNATDRDEIKEAFNDLVNLASQRVHLNKRG
jgi:hypothetical protein